MSEKEPQIEVLDPFGEPLVSQAVLRIYLGQHEEGSGVPVLLVPQPRGLHLWIKSEFRDHPCLDRNGRRRPGAGFTVRFKFGPWENGYLARCSFDPKLGHCLSLPAGECEWLHFCRHRSFEEWANEAGYEAQRITVDSMAYERTVPESIAALRAAGWEAQPDIRTGEIWARRKVAGGVDSQWPERSR